MQTLCLKLTAKCPLSYRLVVGATCLDPQVMLNATTSVSRINTALEVFTEKNRMEPSVADIVKREYIQLCKHENVQQLLKTFRPEEDRLDEFFSNVFAMVNHDTPLKTFVHQLLILFHGNAAVERSFSINKECLVENLHNDSLIAQRVLYDAVWAAGGVASVPITKALIHSARNASARRAVAYKKQSDAVESAANCRKRVAHVIETLESQKRQIIQNSKDETEALNDQLKKLRNALK